ncbi:MAG TPA: TonB family protein, partial [Pyrinomonadaceae bacterium]
MKTLATLLITLTLLAPAARAQGQTPAPLADERDPGRWREYISPVGRFAVLVPGNLVLKTQQMPAPGGRDITLYVQTLSTTAEYGVIHADYPFPVNSPEVQKRLLDDGARGAAESVGARLLDLKEVTLGEHPGRALKEEMRDGRVMHVRMYLVGSRLYQVAITLPKLDADAAAFGEEVASKFLNSFRLLGGAGEGEVDVLIKALRAKGEKVYGVAEGSAQEEAEGWVVSKPAPVYPPIAQAARAQGPVLVEVVVDEEGRVIAAQARSGHPLLQSAAVRAAREVRCKPLFVEGKPA